MWSLSRIKSSYCIGLLLALLTTCKSFQVNRYIHFVKVGLFTKPQVLDEFSFEFVKFRVVVVEDVAARGGRGGGGRGGSRGGWGRGSRGRGSSGPSRRIVGGNVYFYYDYYEDTG